MARRNPPAVPADTSPEVWRMQMEAIGRRTSQELLDEWAELNRRVAEMEAEAMRRRHPDYDDHQIFLCLVRKRYGDELAFEVWPEARTVSP